MFLSLEFPGGDKQASLKAHDLAEGPDWELRDSDDRIRVEQAVVKANKMLGDPPTRFISMIFNQFTWEGTSGWEYWTHRTDYDKVLLHALVVANALNVPLHIHNSFDVELLEAAETAGIELDFVGAEPVAEPVSRRFGDFNLKIERGEYIRLTDVVLPEGTPEVEVWW